MNTAQAATVLRQHAPLHLRDWQGCVCVCDPRTPMTPAEHLWHQAEQVTLASQLDAPPDPDFRSLPAEELTGVHIDDLVTFPVPGLGGQGEGGDVTGTLVAVETRAATNADMVDLTVRDPDTGQDTTYQVKPGTWVTRIPPGPHHEGAPPP